MADQMDNGERALDFVAQHIDCPRCHSKTVLCAACGDAVEHLERLLNEAEDRAQAVEEVRRG